MSAPYARIHFDIDDIRRRQHMTQAPTTSIRLVVATADGITIETAATPRPGPREALIRLLAAGVCGSDVHAAHGRHPFVPLPYRPGHEVVGTVLELGADVASPGVGERVVVEPTLPCWTCKMCRTGRENLCENLQFFGCGYAQGGMADVFSIPADRLHTVPDELDDRAAALIEPLSTPVHAVRLAGELAGKTVAILGAGTIGLLTLAVARHQQPARIVVTDVRADKRERALRLGADDALDATIGDLPGAVRALLGESADVVFDCVSVQPTITAAIAIADKGGTVIVVGVPAAEVVVPLPVIQDHQIRIQGSATYLPIDFAESIRLLVTGVVRADDIVTAQLPLEDAAEAFALASSGEHVKVLVTG
jgi:2-desacetyl-2-hydroxyethyl bacteriochlorophyllide A dehydrogenase